MSLQRDAHQIVIAGASSLLGVELKSLLEESRFAGWDLSLVDEESAAGTLTEAAGEPAIVQPVEEGTFARARLIFFAGSASFTERNLAAAQASGATVIDLSGAALKLRDASVLFSPPDDAQSGKLWVVPSAPGIVGGRLLTTLSNLGMSRFSIVLLRPVSEAGRAGIEELEAQTSQLLSFQSVGQPVFDTQVAFNLLDHYGAGSRENLQSVRERVRFEISSAAAKNGVQPAIQVLHAPVFYGYTFVACVELRSHSGRDLVDLLRKADFVVEASASAPTGNLTATGDSAIHVSLPECDPTQPGTWWLWGVADNIRLPASVAVKLGEKVVA